MSDLTITKQTTTASRWDGLAERVLDGAALGVEEALQVLRCPDQELLELLAAAYRVRHRYFGNQVRLHFLINAKSGLCSEDCGYCSQSKESTADIPKYNLVTREELMAGARAAAQRRARTYCIVLSGRTPRERELDVITEVVPQIKAELGLRICASLGLLNREQVQRLKDCGVNRINHNLNTSKRFHRQICSTHSYEDRLATLAAVREAGLEICAGGIVGMGETPQDVVDMALALRQVEANSIPVNFLLPISGTALADAPPPTPRYCLKVLAMFRLTNPDREIRIAAGREQHLRSLQPLGLFAANSIFVGDYLTTTGQPAADDYRMIEDLGFEIIDSRSA